jgi:hypothetical protein
MKKVILLAAVLFACAKKDEPAPDTAATAVGPPALTAADLAGTWNGTALAENSDSVLFKFTVWSTGMDSKTLTEGSKDTVAVTHMISGDSLVATSAPHVDASMKGKPTVIFRAVGRLTGGKLAGNATVMLASKPDSVIARNRFEMTKAP